MLYRNNEKGIKSVTTTLLWWLLLFSPSLLLAQQNDSTPLPGGATLENCIQYALKHNPEIQNANINEAITETLIKGKLADWYPQINLNYSLQHNFQLPALNFNGSVVHSGTDNTSGLQLGATQNIFNRDALLASRSSKDVRLLSSQDTRQQKINLSAQVSKAFYDIILTSQQLRVIDQDIVRTEQSLKDAYYQYQSGIVDKTDYKRATIALNNAKAQKKSGQQDLKAKTAYLSELMGLPESSQPELLYDTAQMEREILIDTLQRIDYSNRIEIQQLETQKKLQQYNLQYYKWSYLPDVYAFGNYNLNYLNDQLSKLYSKSYPNSFIGITLSFPIFQGGKRIQQIKQAEYQVNQVENDLTSLKNSINTQYTDAMAAYKSNLYTFLSLKENLTLASEVYEIIRLQYRSGVKAYLDVITAESDLRTAQINYYNALYQLLSSKVDVARSLGNISY